jgi:hypothetical protein
VLSEYQQAHTLLYNKLIFGADSLPLLESWRLRDNLDLQQYGGSWLQHPQNRELVAGADLALLHQIQGQPSLQALFLHQATAGSSQPAALDPIAVDVYKAHIQDFLRRLLVLCYVISGQPLYQSKLLSIR